MEVVEKLNPAEAAQSFRKFLIAGIECIYKACELYVQLVDQSKADADEFRRLIPEVPQAAWKRYERVGRKDLHPSFLAWSGSYGVRRIEKLPYSEQEKFSKEHPAVLLAGGESELIPVTHLTKSQANQVFASDHYRNLDEQRTYLDDLKRKALRRNEFESGDIQDLEKQWKVVGEDIIEIRGVRFRRKDLLEMLSEIGGHL